MSAFDLIMTLLSFVFALAIAHVLTTTAELIRAWKRVQFSWLNAFAMLNALLTIVSWWIGLWDLRTLDGWSTGSISVMFVLAMLIYLQARLACPDVVRNEPVDMAAFHAESSWQYMSMAALVFWLSVPINYVFGQAANATEMLEQNMAVLPMALALTAAAIWSTRWVQAGAAVITLVGWASYFSTLQAALR